MMKWVIAWAWVIVVGALIVWPIGPLCIACGRDAASQTDEIIGAITIIVGIAGLASQVVAGAPSSSGLNFRRR